MSRNTGGNKKNNGQSGRISVRPDGTILVEGTAGNSHSHSMVDENHPANLSTSNPLMQSYVRKESQEVGDDLMTIDDLILMGAGAANTSSGGIQYRKLSTLQDQMQYRAIAEKTQGL
ncbi:hypothetical protein FGO68_gene12730 [Halteria grandinella]|uniref:Uncharacterized protein n=1 Tax=Halteria grandinella TaxID=5974 RepID=A0A8J8NJE9_HALGN|nr:hypothetical protein FGO68_gene12730 [Halteria grandinella]